MYKLADLWPSVKHLHDGVLFGITVSIDFHSDFLFCLLLLLVGFLGGESVSVFLSAFMGG